MQILLANAKLMHSQCRLWDRCVMTAPRFQQAADALAAEMALLDIDALSEQLGCSRKLAAENWMRYQHFFSAGKMPALLAYNGQAYKHLKAATLSPSDWDFAQEHLWITCFLYGLLRPLDAVVPYRMEHTVRLPSCGGRPLSAFWKDRLTDLLIASVKADDGVLLHLSTEEYEHLFDWQRVRREVRVVQPLFYVRNDGRMRVQAVWAKTCRGAMARFFIDRRLASVGDLAAFEYEGFAYAPHLGEPDYPHFVKDL